MQILGLCPISRTISKGRNSLSEKHASIRILRQPRNLRYEILKLYDSNSKISLHPRKIGPPKHFVDTPQPKNPA